MKARGGWDKYGRPRIKQPDNWKEVIQSWKAGEITAVEAMRLTGMRKSSFYKLVKAE